MRLRLLIILFPIIATLFTVLAVFLSIVSAEIEYTVSRLQYEVHQKTTQNGEAHLSRDQNSLQYGENHLEIPSIGVKIPLLEGTENVMNQGAWLLPSGVKPNTTGNIIITAHRFKFLPPASNTFFHLDKIKPGDEVKITWENKLYTFYVDAVTIREATDTFVEYPSVTKKLTLYTCTPLWSAEKRLVVIAYPK